MVIGCRRGGTGRRARLKILFPNGSVGSIPSVGTKSGRSMRGRSVSGHAGAAGGNGVCTGATLGSIWFTPMRGESTSRHGEHLAPPDQARVAADSKRTQSGKLRLREGRLVRHAREFGNPLKRVAALVGRNTRRSRVLMGTEAAVGRSDTPAALRTARPTFAVDHSERFVWRGQRLPSPSGRGKG